MLISNSPLSVSPLAAQSAQSRGIAAAIMVKVLLYNANLADRKM